MLSELELLPFRNAMAIIVGRRLTISIDLFYFFDGIFKVMTSDYLIGQILVFISDDPQQISKRLPFRLIPRLGVTTNWILAYPHLDFPNFIYANHLGHQSDRSINVD